MTTPRDTTERSQERLAASEQKVRRQAEMLDLTRDSIIVSDLDAKILFWSKGAEALYGWTAAEAEGRDLYALLPTEYPGASREAAEAEVIAAGRWEGEIHRISRSHVAVVALSRLAVRRTEGGVPEAVIEITTDITERRSAEEELRHQALVDDLTGLYNRRGFLLLAGQQIRNDRRTGRPSTMLFIDLDGMKEINDAHGHPAGDDALREAAGLLRETLRDSDIVARVGGDEFCALVVGTGMYEGETTIERLDEAVATHNETGDRPYRLSWSMGTAVVDPPGRESVTSLIERADEAMYENKAAGKRRLKVLVVDPSRSGRATLADLMAQSFEVVAAGSGEEALDRAVRLRPDAIVLDLSLPDMSGLLAVRLLKGGVSTATIPIVMLTDAGGPADEVESLRSGADDYVTKPFDVQVLAARIARAIHRARR